MLDAARAAHSNRRAVGRETPWGADGLPRRSEGRDSAMSPAGWAGAHTWRLARSALTSTPVAAQAATLTNSKRGLPARWANGPQGLALRRAAKGRKT